MNKWRLLIFVFYCIVYLAEFTFGTTSSTYLTTISDTYLNTSSTRRSPGTDSLSSKYNVVKAITTPSSTGTTTESPIPHNEDYCFEKCITANLTWYFSCMKRCDKSWPFVNGGFCYNLTPESDPSKVTCSPSKFNNIITFVTMQTYIGSKMYLKVSWKPCSAAITALRGFEINVRLDSFFHSCFALAFSPNFTLSYSDKDRVFSFILPRDVHYSSSYRVQLQSLPFDVRHNDYRRVQSPSCQDINGNYSCVCPTNGVTPPPNISVEGYTVNVVLKAANPCRKVERYRFSLMHDTFFDYSQFRNEDRYPTMNQSEISVTFKNVYNFKDPKKILAVSVYFFPINENIKAIDIRSIKAWDPPPPDVITLTPSAIEASFELPTKYEIEEYEIRLSQHEYVDDRISTTDVVSTRSVKAVEAKEGKLSIQFRGLSEGGHYSVQVKEFRIPGKLFNETVWGPRRAITLNQNTNWRVPVVITVVVTTFLIVVFILFLFLWKRGYCQPFRKSLPLQVVQWLDNQTITAWSKKNVLIVWQTDFRSAQLMKKQSEIIRRFSAFLRGVGGLNVIVDLFEEKEINCGLSEWIEKSYSMADNVVFVCPHFDYASEESGTLLTGNFLRMFNYMERDLGGVNRAKFVTVVFPYSNIGSTPATRYLNNMTTVFRLMDQLEDLYFHIQGTPRFDCWGRHSADDLSDRKYESAPGGKELSDALRDMKEKLSSYSRDSSMNDFSSTDNDKEDDPLMRDSISESTSDFQRDYSDEDPNPSVFVHSLVPIEVPLSHLAMKERSPLVPIVPFVENAQEELNKINELSKLSSGEGDLCPYHSDPPAPVVTAPFHDLRSESFKTDPPSGEPPCATQCASVSVEIVDEVQSEGTDTTKDSGFDSTRV